MTTRRSSNLQSVERAITILKSFSLEKPERGVSELAQELGMHKSTISRLMRTLEKGGLLMRNPQTERYRLGLDLLVLADLVVTYMDVREAARPFLQNLADVMQETSFLAVIDAGMVVNLDQVVPTTYQVRHVGRVDRRMTIHCTAAGKAILAYIPWKDALEYLRPPLEKLTPSTITDPDELKKELARVQTQGFAMAFEELEQGLNAIAAPIFEHRGRAMAAIGVAGPAFRLTGGRMTAFSGELCAIAARISRQMGYVK